MPRLKRQPPPAKRKHRRDGVEVLRRYVKHPCPACNAPVLWVRKASWSSTPDDRAGCWALYQPEPVQVLLQDGSEAEAVVSHLHHCRFADALVGFRGAI